MQLKSLEIHGFKSFPDKTKLYFTNKVTAVVGPNGSGKSNIADAMRWVLGEQSIKTLRGARMEDVIFSGTQTRRAGGFSFVALTIDNSDRRLDMDCDDITISRKLFRSGESEYLINNNAVRLKDIHEMLMDTGLGRDGYSIIGQGKIADIVSVKSSERRDIFEEAAGISKFRYRKGEAQRRLDAAYENLLRLKDILLELSSRLEPLAEQSSKAKEFIKLSEQKKQLEISLWIEDINKTKQDLREWDDKIILCKISYESISENMEEIEKQIEAITAQIQDYTIYIEQKYGAIKELESSISSNISNIAVLTNDTEHNKKSIVRIYADTEKLNMSTEAVELEIEKNKLNISSQYDIVNSLIQNRLEIENERNNCDNEVRQITDELEIIERQKQLLQKSISSANVSLAAQSSIKDEVSNQLEVFDKEDFGSQVREVQEELDTTNELLDSIEGQLLSAKNAYDGYVIKKQSKINTLENALKEQSELEILAREKQQRAKLFRELESDMEGFSHSVRYIINQSGNGMISGVLGVVSKLISADETYSTAVEVALGGAGQNIVVENESTAKYAVSQLKKAKAGRVTFLPLTSIKGNEFSKKNIENEDGFLGIASELVRYEAKYELIVKYLLGRCVIAASLSEAVEIAKKYNYRFKIVTLDGQVVNSGGSITGGSIASKGNLMGKRQEIENLEREAKAIFEQAKNMPINLIKEEISAIEANIAGISGEQQRCSEDKIMIIAERKNLMQRLEYEILSKNRKQKETDEIKNKITELLKSSESISSVIEKLNTQNDDYEARQLVLKEKLQTLSIYIVDLNLKYNKLEIEIVSAKKDMEAIELMQSTLIAQQNNKSHQTEELKKELEEYLKQNEQIDSKIKLSHEEIEHLTAMMNNAKIDIDKCLTDKNNAQAKILEYRNTEKTVVNTREDNSKELVKLEERRIVIQTQYDTLVAKLWDDYELTKSEALAIAVKLESRMIAVGQLNQIKQDMKELGNINIAAIQEYDEIYTRYAFMKEQIDDVEKSRDELMKLIKDLTVQMREMFIKNFDEINIAFGQIFTELFGGGIASLTLLGEDVLECGIDIFVQPPGKLINNLSALSGGEQSFVAIAIYFAILKINPAPFCVLDEIEAALDDVNVTKFASYLRRMSENTQFISITHRRGTMESADTLYGVTMEEEGVSKLLELKINEIGVA